jgi:hypothetical protein
MIGLSARLFCVDVGSEVRVWRPGRARTLLNWTDFVKSDLFDGVSDEVLEKADLSDLALAKSEEVNPPKPDFVPQPVEPPGSPTIPDPERPHPSQPIPEVPTAPKPPIPPSPLGVQHTVQKRKVVDY